MYPRARGRQLPRRGADQSHVADTSSNGRHDSVEPDSKEGGDPLQSGASATQDAEDRVGDRVQLPADVVGQKAEDEVAVLLQQLVLSTVPSICDGIRQVLRTIQFQGEARVGTEEVDFQRASTVEGDGQRSVQQESALGLWKRLQALEEKRLRRAPSPRERTACTKRVASGLSTPSRINRRTLPE